MNVRNQRHTQGGGVFHAAAQQRLNLLAFRFRRFDDQFVVHLQNELRGQPGGFQRLVDGVSSRF